MRIALVANRASGGGLDPAPLAAALGGAQVFGCEDEDLAQVEAWGPERIAVAGGDGTIGSVAELAGRLGVPLAVIPTGTANDFARAHGLPVDQLEAAALACAGTGLRALELGRLADGRPFVNVASAGLASVAARRAQPLKSRFGPLAYPLGAARAALTGRPLRVRVIVDDVEVFSGGSWQVMVACTGAFGGGSGIGAADATDGELDVVILPAGSRLALVRRAWGLRAQRVERQRAVQHHEGRVVSVTLPQGTEINCDGEFRDTGLERVSARANAFELVVPSRARPAVERVHPPDTLMRAVNPVMRALLTSSLHRPLSGQLLLVRYVGRRSGRRLEVPAGRVDYDGRTAVISNSPWRLNFRGGRDAELLDRGVAVPVRGTLIEDPEAVADLYARRIGELGWKAAQRRLGIRVNVGRTPTRAELLEAIRSSGLGIVVFDTR